MTNGVTADRSKAAFLSSIFWAALAIGRIVAIPLAVFVTTTNMLRFQLLLSTIASILVLTIITESYMHACIASAALGYGLSSIFPLVMTLGQDYGVTM